MLFNLFFSNPFNAFILPVPVPNSTPHIIPLHQHPHTQSLRKTNCHHRKTQKLLLQSPQIRFRIHKIVKPFNYILQPNKHRTKT